MCGLLFNPHRKKRNITMLNTPEMIVIKESKLRYDLSEETPGSETWTIRV